MSEIAKMYGGGSHKHAAGFKHGKATAMIDHDVMAVIALAVSCPDPAAGIRLLEHGVSVILGRPEAPERSGVDLLSASDLIAAREAEMARARSLYPDRFAATLDPDAAEIDDWKEYLSGR